MAYGEAIKTQVLVADGPYRRVRNALYFANVLMAVGIGTMMSRSGFVFVLLAMVGFCHRLILREESEFQTSQGDTYESYREAVPRFWPSLWPRTASAGRKPNWVAGFKSESWYWMVAAATVVFAATLKFKLFFAILAAGILLLWASSTILRARPEQAALSLGKIPENKE